MNRDQFLIELESLLKGLSREERADILQDFEEHFAIGLSEGKTEEDISTALGSPHQIAKEIRANYHIERVEKDATVGNVVRAVWAVIGLGFFNLFIVLGPFLVLVSLVLAGWIVSVTFTASPLLVVYDMVAFPDAFRLFDLFFSLLLAGFGILTGIAMFYVTRLLMTGFVRYLKYNVNLVKGGLRHA